MTTLGFALQMINKLQGKWGIEFRESLVHWPRQHSSSCSGTAWYEAPGLAQLNVREVPQTPHRRVTSVSKKASPESGGFPEKRSGKLSIHLEHAPLQAEYLARLLVTNSRNDKIPGLYHSVCPRLKLRSL
ncbi:hypothetical protein llap_2671 [Limosa lapponica baueri]|uniref:Uncharacterized protein n=1 Tax=Limosa lapponica baueri TaxID=1758121 RepID=A0A2I0ULW6_LIMLA|nr:hypothetical protein llap_2671 [Limosa lapponica baueri]